MKIYIPKKYQRVAPTLLTFFTAEDDLKHA